MTARRPSIRGNMSHLAPLDRARLAAASPAATEAADAQPFAQEHWHELVTQLGSEIAGPLTAAVERITTLATTGQIDRDSLRALRDEVEAARRVGMVGQQLARFASGRIRQSHETLNLTQLLKEVLIQRGRDLQRRELPTRQILKPTEVVADAALLFSMLNALIDWAIEHAKGVVDLRIDHVNWPIQGRLTCRFDFRAAGDSAGDPRAPSLDTLAWRLVEQCGRSMGLSVERDEVGAETRATVIFPRTVQEQPDPLTAVELDHGFASSYNSKPLAGSHVLVLASRRELRGQVRQAIAHMGLTLDFVSSIEQAREFCMDGLPHAVIYEGVLAGERLDELRDDLRREVAGLTFIELVEEGDVFNVSSHHPNAVARVGRSALQHGLPSALVFELGKTL